MCTDICRSPAPTTAHLCRCVRDPVILPFCLQPARTCSTRAEQNVIMGAIDGESEARAAAERHGREPTTLGSDVEEEELVKYDDLLIMAAIDGNSARCLRLILKASLHCTMPQSTATQVVFGCCWTAAPSRLVATGTAGLRSKLRTSTDTRRSCVCWSLQWLPPRGSECLQRCCTP
jgi:hypothetical protein